MTCRDSNGMGRRPCATHSLVFSAPAYSSCPTHWNPKHFWCRILNAPKPHTMQNVVSQSKYSCLFPSPLLFHWHSLASHVSSPTGKGVSKRALAFSSTSTLENHALSWYFTFGLLNSRTQWKFAEYQTNVTIKTADFQCEFNRVEMPML